MPIATDDPNYDMLKLIFLISHFEIIITEIINDKSLFKNEHIHSLISKTWQIELKEQVSTLIKDLRGVRYHQNLKTVGLTGKQLDLKFTIFSFFLYGSVAQVNFSDISMLPFRVRSKLPTLTKRIIDGFFDFFNSLLGSLSDVIPMVESIKEFKDMVHFEIEYGNDTNSAKNQKRE